MLPSRYSPYLYTVDSLWNAGMKLDKDGDWVRLTELPNDQMLEVRYVTTEAAGGSTRVPLSELERWLASRPGTLIVALRRLY